MASIHPGKPEVSEYNPAFAGYVGKAIHVTDLAPALEQQLSEVLELLQPLDESRQMHRYAPDKWSIKQVLGHITDAERIFSYRLLRIARADQTPLPGFDENSYVANADFDNCPWTGLLEEFQRVRQSTILLLRHLPDSAWTRMGTSNNKPISVRALAYITYGHAAHHLDIVRERYLGRT